MGLLPIVRDRARLRQNHEGLADESAKGKAIEIVARKIGLTRSMFEQIVAIIERGSPDTKKKVKAGSMTVKSGYKDTINRNRKIKETKNTLPTGIFDVIVADPPWKYEFGGRGSPENHYNVMEDKDIMEMKVPSAKDSVLFLWATNPKLIEAIAVMQAWGFTYKSNMVWVKNRIGTGFWSRGRHELLLIGTKGSPGAPKQADRHSSVIESPTQEHSKKPDVAYEIIENMMPGRKYLELFATQKRENWEVWGSDV